MLDVLGLSTQLSNATLTPEKPVVENPNCKGIGEGAKDVLRFSHTNCSTIKTETAALSGACCKLQDRCDSKKSQHCTLSSLAFDDEVPPMLLPPFPPYVS